MKTRTLIIAVLGALLVAVIYFFPGERVVRPGMEAPDFTLPELDGGTVRLQSLRGRVVLVNFWASWCPPCLLEMPSLEQLHRHLEGSDFTVLAVSVDAGWEPVRRFFAKHRVSFPVLLDDAGQTAERYGSFRLPDSFLVDRAGQVVDTFAGAVDWTDPIVIAHIREVMGGDE